MRGGEGRQGAAASSRAPGVAVSQQEIRPGLPDLRALQGLTEALRELLGLAEVAFGVVTVARAQPGSAQGVKALQDAAGVGYLTPQPQGFAVKVLGRGPLVLGFGDSRRCWPGSCRAAPGRGRPRTGLHQFQRITETGLGGLDIPAEKLRRGDDPLASGAQAGIVLLLRSSAECP